MDRRTFCVASSGALFGTAGCLEVVRDRGLRLGGVVLTNRRDDPVRVRLRITRGDATVVDGEYSLEASDRSGSGAAVNETWNGRVAQYTVAVELDSGTVESFTYTADHGHGECTVARVALRPSTIAFSSHRAPDGRFCSAPE
ncbi:hypothetical protein ACFPM1_05940 [Halorubrum rubrum]|uniref:Ig-like domain-containing protein n=1 Tax=Halorubrum rubrum TaxID=1126240 RepID=A0ABD5R073_9EURY|nr:hypothetical protein [Halorubrum rubrum]